MKAYTDIEQSKKLAEILPIESADMHYATWTILVSPNQGSTIKDLQEEYGNQIIPCWSLAALLEQIPSDLLGSNTLTIEKDDSEYLKYGLNYHDRWGREDDIKTKYYDNLVDACVEMIIKLNKKRLL